MARAAAHGTTSERRFSDPTALPLLPDKARARVERLLRGEPPRSLRERAERLFLHGHAQMLIARTVAIDEAVREAGAPQVVILGAGLDGRAWRMGELRDAVVFEVDHPDTQRVKRARVGGLPLHAREVRCVPVDFTRERLDEALAAAGHDAARPTLWIWEGVVMYLTREEVAATLSALARRSAPGSRVVILYTQPALMIRLVGLAVKRLGEPFRSAYTPEAMKALLLAHGFTEVRDEGIRQIGAGMAREVAQVTRVMTHLRVVTAERRAR